MLLGPGPRSPRRGQPFSEAAAPVAKISVRLLASGSNRQLQITKIGIKRGYERRVARAFDGSLIRSDGRKLRTLLRRGALSHAEALAIGSAFTWIQSTSQNSVSTDWPPRT